MCYLYGYSVSFFMCEDKKLQWYGRGGRLELDTSSIQDSHYFSHIYTNR